MQWKAQTGELTHSLRPQRETGGLVEGSSALQCSAETETSFWPHRYSASLLLYIQRKRRKCVKSKPIWRAAQGKVICPRYPEFSLFVSPAVSLLPYFSSLPSLSLWTKLSNPHPLGLKPRPWVPQDRHNTSRGARRCHTKLRDAAFISCLKVNPGLERAVGERGRRGEPRRTILMLE